MTTQRLLSSLEIGGLLGLGLILAALMLELFSDLVLPWVWRS